MDGFSPSCWRESMPFLLSSFSHPIPSPLPWDFLMGLWLSHPVFEIASISDFRPTIDRVWIKMSHLWLATILTCTVLITIIFGTSISEQVGNQNILYFPTSPKLCFCTTWGNRKPEKCIFSLTCCMLFTKNTKHIKISPEYSWTTLHCLNDWLDAPDRVYSPAVCCPHALC